MVERERGHIRQYIIRCRKDAICMPDNEFNTDTHSLYVILVITNSSPKYLVA